MKELVYSLSFMIQGLVLMKAIGVSFNLSHFKA